MALLNEIGVLVELKFISIVLFFANTLWTSFLGEIFQKVKLIHLFFHFGLEPKKVDKSRQHSPFQWALTHSAPGGEHDSCAKEEDNKRDDDHLLPLPSFDSNHLCHHLLQALLL